MRLYLDASAIIYSVEGVAAVRSALRQEISEALTLGGVLLTSRLSRMECRVKPLRDGNADLLIHYDSFFGSRELVIAELTAEVVERATELRVKYNFKVPDALHVATAIHECADVVLTGDAGFLRCTDVRVKLVKQS